MAYISIYAYNIYIYYYYKCIHACRHSFIHASMHPSIHPSLRPSVHPSIHTYYMNTYIYIDIHIIHMYARGTFREKTRAEYDLKVTHTYI